MGKNAVNGAFLVDYLTKELTTFIRVMIDSSIVQMTCLPNFRNE